MSDTPKDILEWITGRLSSVPENAQMIVKVELGYFDEEGNWRVV
jgi:hypothetical protein